MTLLYHSTRNKNELVSASQAILRGIAPDGGLYVPVSLPLLDVELADLPQLTYQEVAYEVMKLFLNDFTETELKACIDQAYDDKFDTETMVELKKAGSLYYLELFHGPTLAFKDMALSILPHLLTTAVKKNNSDKELVILTATSGDTGKAALEGFADVAGTKIIVFYPKNGVSPFQERQMITQRGENVLVVAIEGNFDDAQSEVKELFADQELAQRLELAGYQFSSANSINIGRLIPQIVYYVYAYGQLLKQQALQPGEQMTVSVPTGNFGNVLAAYYAKQIGLPIQHLLVASNENNVLTDFFQTNLYDRRRPFVLTSSPSMDILISSNLERLLYYMAGEDTTAVAAFMQQLKKEGRYEVTAAMRARAADFLAGFATEAEVTQTIRAVFEKEGYVLDPHTAVASLVAQKYAAAAPDAKEAILVASTASPYKFPEAVLRALRPEKGSGADLPLRELLTRLEKDSGLICPPAVQAVLQAEVRHDHFVPIPEMKQIVETFLGI